MKRKEKKEEEENMWKLNNNNNNKRKNIYFVVYWTFKESPLGQKGTIVHKRRKKVSNKDPEKKKETNSTTPFDKLCQWRREVIM